MQVQRTCKKCGQTQALNRKNFRYQRGSFSRVCRACIRKQNKKYYHEKTVPARRSQKLDFREAHLREQLEKYDKIFTKLERLGVDPDSKDYTAGEIDQILEEGQKAVHRIRKEKGLDIVSKPKKKKKKS